MKLTNAKRKWVVDKIKHYCDLLKVPVPNVYMTMAEYNRWKKEARGQMTGARVGSTHCLGVCHGDYKSKNSFHSFIVILVKKCRDIKALDEVIRHELLHWAKPSYNHFSTEFADRMERLKKGKLNSKGRFIK